MAQQPYPFSNQNQDQPNYDPNTTTMNGQPAIPARLGPEYGLLYPGTPVQNVISSYVYHLMPVNFVPVLQQVDIFRRSGIPGSLLELTPQQFVIVPHQPAQNVSVAERPGDEQRRNIQGLPRFDSSVPEQNVSFAERMAERYRIDHNQDYVSGDRLELPRFSPAEQAEYLNPLGESEAWQSAYSTVITTARQINRGPSLDYPDTRTEQVNRQPGHHFADTETENPESEHVEVDSTTAATESRNAGAAGENLAEDSVRVSIDRLIRRMDSFEGDEEDTVYRRPHVTALAQQLAESVTHLLPESLRELNDTIGTGRVERGRRVVAPGPAIDDSTPDADGSSEDDFEIVLHELHNLNTLECESKMEQQQQTEAENQSLRGISPDVIYGNPQGTAGVIHGNSLREAVTDTTHGNSIREQVTDIINVNRLTETVTNITHGNPSREAVTDIIHGHVGSARGNDVCSSNGSEGHSVGLNNRTTRNAANLAEVAEASEMTHLGIRALRNQLQYDWTLNLGLPEAAETYDIRAGEMTGTILHELLRNLSNRGNRVGNNNRQSSLRQYYNNLVYQFFYETFLWMYLAVSTDPRSISTWALIQVISQIAGQSPEDVSVTMLAGFLESGISQTMEYTDVLEESFARIERNRAVGPEDEMIMRELAMRMNIQLDPRRMLRRFGDVIRQAARVLLIDAASSFHPVPQR